MRIAVLTMVRNDDFYLRKWVEYYGRELGRENLYIFFDGKDQVVPSFCEGARCEVLEKIGTDVVSNDKGRVAVMSAKAAELLAAGYDRVIGTDVPVKGCLSALGLDVGQRLGEETDIREDAPFLSQRHYALLGTRYTKASVLSEPLEWGSGFHRVRGRDFHIVPDLYLFHLGYFDKARIEARFADPSRREQGWKRHLEKRTRVIRTVSRKKARPFDGWTRFARICQTLVRPPYAWNKPAMFGLRIVVRIPDRFGSVL